MSSPTMVQEYPELNTLNPLLNSIVDKTVDNVARKLIGGFRNKRNSQPNAKAPTSVQRWMIRLTPRRLRVCLP